MNKSTLQHKPIVNPNIAMMMPYVLSGNVESLVHHFGGFRSEFAVTYGALYNDSLPEHILLHCASHSNPRIRNGAAQHPNATDTVKLTVALHA